MSLEGDANESPWYISFCGQKDILVWETKISVKISR